MSITVNGISCGITQNGFVLPQLTDIQADVNQTLKNKFGAGINLQPQSFFGQVSGIWSERESRTSVSARSLLGTTLSILVDHRIPVLFLPSRGWAEYAAAWVLRRCWRRWLVERHESQLMGVAV